MSQRIGIIGQGNVGTALSHGLERAGHEVRAVGRDPDKVREVADWADVVVLAVPYGERRNAIEAAGPESLRGKTIVDVTNALDGDGFAGSLETSGAEEVQSWLGDDCCVVKAFNTAFAGTMEKGLAANEPITLFVAGDDASGKQEVQRLGTDLGFDPVDAGPLENARWLEALGYFNIKLGYSQGLGPDAGFRYVHAAMAHVKPAARRAARPRTGTRARTEPRGARSTTSTRRAKATKGMKPQRATTQARGAGAGRGRVRGRRS